MKIRWLGLQAYDITWQAMRDFTNNRDDTTEDEIWLLEHPPVFTQGQNGKPEHVLNPRDIPIIQTDRGGQVTYHGPGQLMLYLLLDLKRLPFKVRDLVSALEKSVIELLAAYNIKAYAKCSAPGVYVDVNGEKKICSIGLRIRKYCTYHGIAFNIAMDLEPFTRINPCGYENLMMIDCQTLGGPTDVEQAGRELCGYLMPKLSHTLSI